MKWLLPLLIVFFSSIFFFIFIKSNPYIFKKFDAKDATFRFSQSQWMQSQNISPIQVLDQWALKKGYTGWNNFVDENKERQNTANIKRLILGEIKSREISDAQLYEYVGYLMLTKHDLSINREHPPLGKYLIGLSILLWRNTGVIVVICSALILVCVFSLVYLLTRSFLRSAVALLLTVLQGSLIDQIQNNPQLDIFQLFFLLITLFCFVLFLQKRKIILLCIGSVFLGLFLCVKSTLIFGIITLVWISVFMVFLKKEKLHTFQNALAVAMGVTSGYLIPYIPFFVYGFSLIDFLKQIRYAFIFYSNSSIPIMPFVGNSIRLIFTGSWKFWSSGYPVSNYKYWNILWPLLFVAGLLGIWKNYTYIRKNTQLLLFGTLLCVLFAFFLVIPIFPRYFILFYITLIIFLCSIPLSYFHGTKK